MIGPRMATMLGFLLTDASVPTDRPAGDPGRSGRAVVQLHLGRRAHEHQRHGLAPGQRRRGAEPLSGGDLDAFADLVRDACIDLGPDDPRRRRRGDAPDHDRVEGCRDRDEARTIARAVADSPLVKTAIHGADPNWGRIVSAAGYAGVAFEERELSLWLNGDCPLPRRHPPALRRRRASRRSLESNARDTSAWLISRRVRRRSGSGPATSRPSTSGSMRTTRPDFNEDTSPRRREPGSGASRRPIAGTQGDAQLAGSFLRTAAARGRRTASIVFR